MPPAPLATSPSGLPCLDEQLGLANLRKALWKDQKREWAGRAVFGRHSAWGSGPASRAQAEGRGARKGRVIVGRNLLLRANLGFMRKGQQMSGA